MRSDYVELLLTGNIAELQQVLGATGGELLETRLPKTTRFLVVENGQDTNVTKMLGRDDYRVVTFDGFLATIIDIDHHLAEIDAAHPSLPAETAELRTLSGDLLRTDSRTGEIRHEEVEDAHALLEEFAATSANVLVMGRPGSGKSSLLKRLVRSSPVAATRRHRFFFDLRLKGREEDPAEFVTRTLSPCTRVDRGRVFDVCCTSAATAPETTSSAPTKTNTGSANDSPNSTPKSPSSTTPPATTPATTSKPPSA